MSNSKIKIMRKITLFICCLFAVLNLQSQDLSKIDLSKLTPEQVAMYKQYMATKGGAAAPTTTPVDVNVDRTNIQTTAPVNSGSPIYGAYIFNTQNLTFEPKLDIATPTNYIIGVNDEIVIDISGLYEANYKLKVSPEGNIRIPNIGPVRVSGKSIEEATSKIRNEIAKVYQGVSSGETKVNITLGSIRSIRVTIVGDATRPGTYTLPSLATAFNAVYACGGPTEAGSMRQIRVIRNNKTITIIDVYKFLQDGIIENNVILHDDDVIKFEPVKNRVTLTGSLKHTGKFETLDGETLNDLIKYAGGFKEDAYTELATVVRIADNQKKVIDVPSNQFKNFKILPGDEYTFSGILNKFSNRVDITGSVNRPGIYELKDGLTVSQLVQKANGLKEDAFLNRAFITRLRENQIPEVLSFNLGEILNGKNTDIILQKDDRVEIKSLFEYRQNFNVSIAGEVQAPGTFPWVENLTLLDLISKAKGFTIAAATDSVELIRIIKDKDLLSQSNQKTVVKKFKIDKNLIAENSEGNIVLENGDQVVVRKISGYEGIRMVKVEGEVLRPGSYNIISKGDYISDLIKRSGGLTKYAYAEGAFLIRNQKFDESQQKLNTFMTENASTQLKKSSSSSIDANLMQQVGLNNLKDITAIDSLQMKLTGTTVLEEIGNTEGLVGINLKKIMQNPKGRFDLKLEEGDVIYIPRELQTVRIIGEVYFPTYVKFQRGLCVKDYLSNAGGASSKANKYKIFVLYPNGTSKSTKNFLGFRMYPKILPGSQIIVPQKQIQITQKMTPGETITVLTSTVSMAALVYSIVSNTINNNTTAP